MPKKIRREGNREIHDYETRNERTEDGRRIIQKKKV